DLDLAGERGAGLIEDLQQRMLPFAILTASSDGAELARACTPECLGLLPKSLDADALLNAVHRILEGERVIDERLQTLIEEARNEAALLTDRQREVLMLLADGLPNKLIADRLGLTEITVKTHVSAIMHALGVRNRTECIVQAMRRGLIGTEDSDSV
ncbi:MAG: DNA-binding response regulator, partial [Gammaproteobacteria bacterium]